MKYFLTLFLIFSFISKGFSQTQIPENYFPFKPYLHAIAGLNKPLVINLSPINIDTTGKTDISIYLNTELKKTTDSLHAINPKLNLVFVLPSGTFLILNPIFIPNYTTLQGQGAANTIVVIKTGEGNAGFYIKPIQTNPLFNFILETEVPAGRYSIPLSLNQGKILDSFFNIDTSLTFLGALQIQNDADLITSSWAKGCVKELFIVGDLDFNNGNYLLKCKAQQQSKQSNLSKSFFTLNYSFTRKPVLQIYLPSMYSGIACLKIVRADTTTSQTSNIVIENAVYSELKAIESKQCNFAHVSLNHSFGCLIKRCNFSYANGYGGGGKAYGLAIQSSATSNNIGDNVFKHLRHSILLQSGANNNIIIANYSYDPFWQEGFFPSDAAGDIVLHGNYPFANLFELNMAQQIVLDNSHGKNGPKNVFNRNYLQGYGIAMPTANGSDSQVFTGNEVLNALKGFYTLQDAGHFTFANYVKGVVTPAGTGNFSTPLYAKPSYAKTYTPRSLIPHYPSFIDFSNPMFGPPYTQSKKTIPAFSFANQLPICLIKNEDSLVYIPLNTSNSSSLIQKPLLLFPNPTTSLFSANQSGLLNVYTLAGSIIYTTNYIANSKIVISKSGIYLIEIKTPTTIYTNKLIVIHD